MSTADFLIHVHPELSAGDRAKVEQAVAKSVGVISASFDKHTHPHALMIAYDPDTVRSQQILNVVREFDPAATMIGM